MGIKDLSKFLCNTCPDLTEEIHISEYAFKKVAVDVSLYLCKYKVACGEEGWLRAFVNLVKCLRENEIHCVFIYDTGSPPEKIAEKAKRANTRDKLEERIYRLEEAVDKFHTTGEVDPYLVEFQTRRKITTPRLLRAGQTMINIGAIEYALKKMKNQLFHIRPEDFVATKKLFDILDVPYFQAPMEAETMCADLCKRGEVDAVLSEDTDVLAYGAPVFLTKFNNGVCHRIHYKKMLEQLEFTPEQFLDFCIMCGTDYNKNIFRVGPSKSYALIRTHKDIETVGEKSKYDISVLNHVRGRELFLDYEQKIVSVPYCGTPDFSALEKFLVQKNIPMNINALRKSFVHNTLVFEEESEEEVEFVVEE